MSYLANEQNVAANTQNQAFASLCYLYREVLNQPLENVSALRAKRPQRIREVLDVSEIVTLFNTLHGIPKLIAQLMYGCSFRIGEVAEIRMKDICFNRKQIVVRGGKGEKDRVVGFPSVLHEQVRNQIASVKSIWKDDVAQKRNGVSLPKAWGRKSPYSRLDFAWWYLFPSGNYSECPRTKVMYRHHRDMGNVGRHIRNAARKSGIPKRITSHCLRHSFATHSLENGVPIHVIQKILGHNNIETTETYLHVSKDGVSAARSPLEALNCLS